METFMCLRLVFSLLTIGITSTLASAGSPSDGFHGYFYNPSWHGGCYDDGVVYRVKKDRIMLYARGDQNDYLNELTVTDLSDQFIIEGVPSTSVEIIKRFKKVIITYKTTDTGFRPIAMTIDGDVLEVQRASSRTILENGYSMERCDSPSFMGWLLMTIGWHTVFEPTGAQ
jgi:hypothetical protein